MISDQEFEDVAFFARLHGLEKALQRLANHRPASERASWIDEVRAEYVRRTESAKQGFPPKIFALPHQEPWYALPLETDRFWPGTKATLAVSRIPDDQIQRIDESSSKIVAYTPNPSLTKWQSKGLVVGYVQSGKTTSFTSVVAKAADVGYNFIVVLSGIHNGLRRQTQERLEVQLKGPNPDSWITLTSLERDFHRPTHTLESILPKPGEPKAVLSIVKKNPVVLKRLKTWLTDAAHDGGLRHVKALIIDDEADQASVETPKINPLLRDIIGMLPRCTYIGYTATPFANLLINPAVEDLYPKDFVLTLPPPAGYFGTEMIFGRDEIPDAGDRGGPVDGYDMVRIIPDTEAAQLRPQKGQAFDPAIPDSLREAVLWFWLATAVRRSRGDHRHSTMLLHTSMKTSAHQAFKGPIEELRRETLADLTRNDASLRAELAALWHRETSAVRQTDLERHLEISLERTEFEEAMAHLPDVVRVSTIVLDNSRSKERLSYDGDAVTAIAIGGNTLSRGLTLEGLVVSYFIRSATAYDTLLQMGRWFGFRRGYEDLPRIWMTDELRRWYRHLASVEHEMRLDILRLEEQDLTPQEFGIRLRTHPTLLVTQKLGASVQAFTSFGGRRVQERYFKRTDAEWIQTRNLAASVLVAASQSRGRRDSASVAPGVGLWRDVPVADIQQFLRAFRFHEDSPDLNSDLLLKYIDMEVRVDSLHQWSVAVMGSDDRGLGTIDLGGFETGCIVRARLKDGSSLTADIKTLMSKEHRVIDLPISQTAARRTNEDLLAEERNKDQIHRNRGLLLLYPIHAYSDPAQANSDSREALDAVDNIVAAALVFPGNAETSVQNSYITVDLTGVIPSQPLEDPDDVEELLEADTEDQT